MKKSVKRPVSLLLALIMVFSFAAVPAFAETAHADEDFPAAIQDNPDETKAIYVGGEYNSLERMTEPAAFARAADSELANLDPIYLTIYANSTHNESAEKLLDFVREKKPRHNAEGRQLTAVWGEDEENTEFDPKGQQPTQWGNVWYSYTAELKDKDGSTVQVSQSPRAYVLVIPVNASPVLEKSSEILGNDVIAGLSSEEDMRSKLGLPDKVAVTYDPAQASQWPTEAFTGERGECAVTGWKMNGKPLTLAALKAMVSDKDVEVTLTPVYSLPVWATPISEPTFRLTIAPKIPVDVEWSGSENNKTVYGEALDPGTPVQKEKDGGVDDTDTFTWDHVYYQADGKTRLKSAPTAVGTYKVQAILNSKTHSGVSPMREFTIEPKNIGSGLTFTLTAAAPTYNKQPQTPEYTVKYGRRTLKKGTDYTAAYADNVNAGPASVTFTGMGNYTGTKTESFTIKKLALTESQKPSVSGTAASGQVLSASLDGVDAAELEWVWTVGGSEVQNNSTASYEVMPWDSNKEIIVTAKAVEGGNYSGSSGASLEKRARRLQAAGSVTVTAGSGLGEDGKIVPGTVLTAAVDVVPASAGEGGAWRWKVDGEASAAGETYTVAKGDKEIVAVFTPGGDYAGTVESAVIEVGRVPLTGSVSIVRSPAGDVKAGTKLTAGVTGVPALEEGKAFTLVWLRDGQPISGADKDEYTITDEDRGRNISVKLTAGDYTGELVSAGVPVPVAAPGQPSVTVTPGDKKLNISWSAPSDNGGAPVTGYKLAVGSGGSAVMGETLLAASQTGYTLSGLKNGTEYTVSLSAVNRAGDSAAATANGTPSVITTINPDGSTTTTETREDGTVISITTKPDGGTTTVESRPNGAVTTIVKDALGNESNTEKSPDGSIVSTVHHKDGCNGTIETDTAGRTIAVTDVPAEVAGEAVGDGSAVPLPVVGIRADRDIGKAPSLVVNTFGVDGVKVRIPVENMGVSVVAVEIKSDGTPVVISNTVQTEDGVMVRVNDGEVIRIQDNRKSFKDAKGHWAEEPIAFASSRALLAGTSSNTFSPNVMMTRGMLVTVLARFAGVDTNGGAAWYSKGAAWAKDNGLFDGTGLNKNITRESLVTIMYRYAKLQGKAESPAGGLEGYKDADLVSSWAVEAMSWAVDTNLITGTSPAVLSPQGYATRAQAAAIFKRYAELFGL